MHARGLRHQQLTPAVRLTDIDVDAPGVSIPHAEASFGVRLGSFELHAMGAREKAHRKQLRGGQRTMFVQLKLGASSAVFGVEASALTGRIVPLRDLWGASATERLRERLAATPNVTEMASILEQEITARTSSTAHTKLALEAATKLENRRVHDVANELGVSERNLRRVFHEEIGMSPKTFAKLSRFHRALRAARSSRCIDWAGVAASTGYYDQAHLIGEFREIAGVTPVALLDELSQ